MERSERDRRAATSRRSFLTKAGIGAGLVTIGTATVPFASLLTSATAQEEPELTDGQIAGFAESVELAAVEAHRAAAATGKLSAALVQIGMTFAQHHAEHATAFGAAAGTDGTSKANAKLLATVADQLANAKDQNGVLQILFDLENAAAATYLFAVGELDDAAAVALAASVLPVESQHAVALGQAMGKPLADVVPSFENQDRALDPAKFPTTTSATTTTTTK